MTLTVASNPEPPAGASEDELARWFSQTDLSELEVDEIEASATPVRGAAGRLQTVAVRLPGWEVEELKKRAARQGVGYTTYVRLLVNRHLLDEEGIR